jgi:hypothetical protein
MLDRSEVGKRGYLHEGFRLFRLKDSRAQKLKYHYHEFDKLILLLAARSPMSSKASPISCVRGISCWCSTT